MEIVLNKILSQIHHQEDKLSSQMMPTADEAYQMTLFLNEMLCAIKKKSYKPVLKMNNKRLIFLGILNRKY